MPSCGVRRREISQKGTRTLRETCGTLPRLSYHWGVASADVDADIKRYEAMGMELAFRAGVPTGGDVAYMDTSAVRCLDSRSGALLGQCHEFVFLRCSRCGRVYADGRCFHCS